MPMIRNTFTHKKKLISDINVTPFVDIMLVLLVVFMVASPMMVPGIQVDLPQTTAAPLSSDEKAVVVTVNKQGSIYLQDKVVDISFLNKRIAELLHNNKSARVFIRADKDVNYGTVVKIMSMIKASGFTKIALITNHESI